MSQYLSEQEIIRREKLAKLREAGIEPYPAEDAAQKRRELVWIKRIPALWKKVME